MAESPELQKAFDENASDISGKVSNSDISPGDQEELRKSTEDQKQPKMSTSSEEHLTKLKNFTQDSKCFRVWNLVKTESKPETDREADLTEDEKNLNAVNDLIQEMFKFQQLVDSVKNAEGYFEDLETQGVQQEEVETQMDFLSLCKSLIEIADKNIEGAKKLASRFGFGNRDAAGIKEGPKSEQYHPRSDESGPGAEPYHPRSDESGPGAEPYHPRSDESGPGAAAYHPASVKPKSRTVALYPSYMGFDARDDAKPVFYEGVVKYGIVNRPDSKSKGPIRDTQKMVLPTGAGRIPKDVEHLPAGAERAPRDAERAPRDAERAPRDADQAPRGAREVCMTLMEKIAKFQRNMRVIQSRCEPKAAAHDQGAVGHIRRVFEGVSKRAESDSKGYEIHSVERDTRRTERHLPVRAPNVPKNHPIESDTRRTECHLPVRDPKGSKLHPIKSDSRRTEHHSPVSYPNGSKIHPVKNGTGRTERHSPVSDSKVPHHRFKAIGQNISDRMANLLRGVPDQIRMWPDDIRDLIHGKPSVSDPICTEGRAGVAEGRAGVAEYSRVRSDRYAVGYDTEASGYGSESGESDNDSSYSFKKTLGSVELASYTGEKPTIDEKYSSDLRYYASTFKRYARHENRYADELYTPSNVARRFSTHIEYWENSRIELLFPPHLQGQYKVTCSKCFTITPLDDVKERKIKRELDYSWGSLAAFRAQIRPLTVKVGQYVCSGRRTAESDFGKPGRVPWEYVQGIRRIISPISRENFVPIRDDQVPRAGGPHQVPPLKVETIDSSPSISPISEGSSPSAYSPCTYQNQLLEKLDPTVPQQRREKVPPTRTYIKSLIQQIIARRGIFKSPAEICARIDKRFLRKCHKKYETERNNKFIELQNMKRELKHLAVRGEHVLPLLRRIRFGSERFRYIRSMTHALIDWNKWFSEMARYCIIATIVCRIVFLNILEGRDNYYQAKYLMYHAERRFLKKERDFFLF